jgi:GH15 family glucan-1,4-alpha-glucosidase
MQTTTPSYLPIADHGVIGDLRTVALVGTNGTIDWYCPGRFDAPSVFGSILDSEKGGFYRIAPVAACTTKQLYFPDTNVLMTRFLSSEGVGEVHDFMPLGGRQQLIRRVTCVRGAMRFRLECEPRFDYGRERGLVVAAPGGALFRSSSLSLLLGSETPLEATRSGARAEFELRAGETATFVLEEPENGRFPSALTEAEAQAVFEETVEFWTSWIAKSTYTGRWREMVNRSALALKLLTYQPTGAIVAAATTSLPEQLGGGRNWDYRFTWMRDASFTLYALLRLGFTEEAQAFGGFLTECFSRPNPNGNGPLQLMYGIDGRHELPEETLDHLEGYMGSSPVRIGNGAAGQLQLDIYGELIDAAYLAERYGRGRMHYDNWRGLSLVIEWICENWDQPDEGIWETRGGAKHFTHSRLMSWVAIDRAVRIARDRAFPADIVRWMAVRDEIFPAHHGAQLEREAAGVRAARGHRRARRGRAAHAARPLHLADGPALALDARRDRRGPRLRQPRLPLRPRGVARRARRRRGHVLDLQLLVRRGALARRPPARGAARLREDAHVRESRRSLLGGDRPERRAARQLPAGVHAPRADQRGGQPRPEARLTCAPTSSWRRLKAL